jgi:regulatory protein
MIVTDIVRTDKKKSLIYIDYEKAFSLYNSEIKRLGIETDKELDSTSYNEIMNDILPERCRERAVYILKDSDKSEFILRDKLSKGGYPAIIIDKVIADFKEYNYIDDERYVKNYVKYNISAKSKSRIINELYAKGICKTLISGAFDEYEDEDINEVQYELVKKEFLKKRYDFLVDDKNLLNKIIAALMRKGFKYDDIMQVYYELKREN